MRGQLTAVISYLPNLRTILSNLQMATCSAQPAASDPTFGPLPHGRALLQEELDHRSMTMRRRSVSPYRVINPPGTTLIRALFQKQFAASM